MEQSRLEDYNPSGDSHTCPTCGDAFDTRQGLGTHHSRLHGESIREYERRQEGDGEHQCPECGTHFRSRKGVKAHYGQAHDGTLHDRVEVECAACGDTLHRAPHRIERSGSDRQFCDSECRVEWHGDYLSGKDSPLYSKVETECAICGEAVLRHRSEYEANENHVCSDDCFSELCKRRTGPDHPRWTGGRRLYQAVRHSYPRGWFRPAREARKRAGHECEMCGSAEDGSRKLDVHHIVPVRAGGTNEPWNLMALCRSCHRKAESYTQNIFQDHLSP